jgi:hypothetical protein
MLFSGLSEQEVEKISKLLKSENITHEIVVDQEMLNANQDSISYNLRHLHSPNISTHVLAIKINNEDFEGISDALREKLLDFGITNMEPEEFKNQTFEHTPEPIQNHIKNFNIRIIGQTFLIILIIAFIFLLGLPSSQF